MVAESPLSATEAVALQRRDRESRLSVLTATRQALVSGGRLDLEAFQRSWEVAGASHACDIDAAAAVHSPDPTTRELASYDFLATGAPATACRMLGSAAEAYAAQADTTSHDALRSIHDALLAGLFPAYTCDDELLLDISAWARERLVAVYPPQAAKSSPAPTEDAVQGGAERPAAPDPCVELKQRWILRLQSTHRGGGALRFDLLRQRLDLNNEDCHLLLLLLAMEYGAGFDALRRALVNDDDHYEMSLLLAILCEDDQDRQRFLARLAARAPLVRHRLLYLNTPSHRIGTSLPNRLVELDECVPAFVGGRDHWPEGIDHLVTLHPQMSRPSQAFYAQKLELLDRAMRQDERPKETAFVAICGATVDTTLSLALAWAAVQGRSVLEVTANVIGDPIAFERLFRLITREALLREAIIFVDGGRRWEERGRETRVVLRSLLRSCAYCKQPVLFDAPLEGDEVLSRVLSPFFVVRVLPPTLDEQVEIWQEALAHEGLPSLAEPTLRTHVCDMALNVDDIHRAVALAANGAWLRAAPAERVTVSPDALRAMATSKLNQGMYALAERVSTTLSWGDVILPETAFTKLMEIVTYARYQRQVFEEWGFGAKLPYGRANSSIFTGLPGTGKTMVAGIIARELGRDLFRVDMSSVVSKYIGETEKNLGKVFDEAARGHAVVLFDEADSLFAKRTEVKSHHDRYSNLEVNYLLQRVETFDGITILTSNFPENIDEAFSRRIKFRVHFPLPDEAEREHLWRLMLPKAARVADTIDFTRLAHAFEFTGANIKDTVLRAAFNAAERDVAIDLDLLEEAGIAVSREMGKLIRVKEGRVDLPKKAKWRRE